MLSLSQVSQRHITLYSEFITAFAKLILLSTFTRLLTFSCRMLTKPSQFDLVSTEAISTFAPSLNSSKIRILSLSRGTSSVNSSLLFFRIRFSLRASSLLRAGSNKYFSLLIPLDIQYFWLRLAWLHVR